MEDGALESRNPGDFRIGMQWVEISGEPVYQSHQADTDGKAARAFSILAICYSIGSFAGPVIAGFSIDHWGNHAAIFIWVVPAIAMLWLLTKSRSASPVPVLPPIHQSGPRLLSIPEIRKILVVSAAITMGWDVYNFAMPLHATHLQISATAIGTLSGCFAAGSFAIRMFTSRIAGRWGEERVLRASLWLTCIGYSAYAFTSSFVAMALLGAALGMVLGVGQPMSWAVIHMRAPAGRVGEALGIRGVIVSICQASLPLTFGMLGAALGTEAIFMCVAILVGACLIATRGR